VSSGTSARIATSALEVDDVPQGAFGIAEYGRDLHRGVVAPEGRDDFGGVKRPDGGNAQMASGRLAMRGRQLVGLVAEAHDAAGDLEQRGAGFGELSAP
jgi:hypothetical protein